MTERSPSIGASATLARNIDARIDAMPRAGHSRSAWLALMLTFFFANYDIAVVSLALPQTIATLGMSGAELGYPVTANLIAFGVGASALGYLADRYGRQVGLFGTIGVLGVGGFLTALSWDVASLTFFRFVTGCGMGAVIALCTAYVGETVPRSQRGGYQARMFLVGSVLQLVVGFASLPVLAATDAGWRWLFGFGGIVIVLVPFINRSALVESPRWLAAMGRADEADRIVARMETRVGLAPGSLPVVEAAHGDLPEQGEAKVTVRALFRTPYLGRITMILTFWFVFYLAMYGFTSYIPLFLEANGLSTSTAIFVTVLSRVSPLVSSLAIVLVIERYERRTLVVGGVALYAVALGIVGFGTGQLAATIGVLLTAFALAFVGPASYTYTSEIFPTRARGTASAVGDGVGHFGGAVAPFVVLPILGVFGAQPALVLLAVLALAAAAVLRLGPVTRNRSLEDIAADPELPPDDAAARDPSPTRRRTT